MCGILKYVEIFTHFKSFKAVPQASSNYFYVWSKRFVTFLDMTICLPDIAVKSVIKLPKKVGKNKAIKC